MRRRANEAQAEGIKESSPPAARASPERGRWEATRLRAQLGLRPSATDGAPRILRAWLGRDRRRKQIRRVCDAIVREFHPKKILLFGSHAYGKPRPDSDVDLLVVMDFEGSPFRQAALILGHVVRTVGVLPMDLLVRTPKQVRERLRMGDRFLRDVFGRGKVMHEADHP